jgi:putative flippase GtrA
MSGGRLRRGAAAEAARFVRANLSSLTASGLEYALVTGLVVAGVHYLTAAAAGAVMGAVTDFSLKRHWAFARGHKAAVHHEALRYLAVSSASLGLNLLGSWLLVDGLRLPSVPGVIAASIAVGLVWNYPLHRWFVFRRANAALAPVPVRAAAGAASGEERRRATGGAH